MERVQPGIIGWIHLVTAKRDIRRRALNVSTSFVVSRNKPGMRGPESDSNEH
jgi:hypothetical protein